MNTHDKLLREIDRLEHGFAKLTRQRDAALAELDKQAALLEAMTTDAEAATVAMARLFEQRDDALAAVARVRKLCTDPRATVKVAGNAPWLFISQIQDALDGAAVSP